MANGISYILKRKISLKWGSTYRQKCHRRRRFCLLLSLKGTVERGMNECKSHIITNKKYATNHGYTYYYSKEMQYDTGTKSMMPLKFQGE